MPQLSHGLAVTRTPLSPEVPVATGTQSLSGIANDPLGAGPEVRLERSGAYFYQWVDFCGCGSASTHRSFYALSAIITVQEETATDAPAPAELPLFALGLGALALIRHRQRRS